VSQPARAKHVVQEAAKAERLRAEVAQKQNALYKLHSRLSDLEGRRFAKARNGASPSQPSLISRMARRGERSSSKTNPQSTPDVGVYVYGTSTSASASGSGSGSGPSAPASASSSRPSSPANASASRPSSPRSKTTITLIFPHTD
ncbi:uncharacterized protein TRAVEDRAFT_51032, partial [Trametes versicolor FP-101664 SS1]|uniref:uncharacterized protein n=1 Tax=Trametes versicolor (strain FP-101664) TaxID=717944 RepID=UPI0004621333